MTTRILVTGPLGCFGIATIKWLLAAGHHEIIAFGRSVTPQRLLDTFGSEHAEHIRSVAGSVANHGQLESVFREFRPTHVAHFAGLQTPDCQNNPAIGWETNVSGTENIYRLGSDELYRSELERIVAISSAAVYGPASLYPDKPVKEDAAVRKSTVYSKTKIAVELIAERYWEMHGRSSLVTRPFICFGPGRHQGMSAAYTMAIIATALKMEFIIPFFGTYDFSYVPDVGETHGRLLVDDAPNEFSIYNIPSQCMETREFCQLVKQASAELDCAQGCNIQFSDDRDMPTTCNLDWARIKNDFHVPCTPLPVAIRQTLRFYLDEVAAGRITADLVDQWAAGNTSY
jgi:UDP-glucose 4-epimerase